MPPITSDTPAFLCSVRDNIEAAIVESLLKSSNIPVMKKWRNGGDIVMLHMAMSSTGVELYVPSKLLEEAKLLLSAEPVMPVVDETGETYETNEPVSVDMPDDYLDFAEEKAKDRRSKARLIVFLLFGLPILIFVLIFLWHGV